MMEDNTEELVNTTHRYSHYCSKKRKSDGQKCSLYSPHEGDHKTKHLASSFSEEEAE
jgi:hypothetical protein